MAVGTNAALRVRVGGSLISDGNGVKMQWPRNRYRYNTKVVLAEGFEKLATYQLTGYRKQDHISQYG
jgi:hypothetical protein